MTFEIKAIRYTRESFLARVHSLTWKKGWRPTRICLHNMGSPDIAQGMKTPEADREEVFKHYYQNMGWHSGPHLSIWPDSAWELCDLEQDGVHASCFNRGALTSIGVEMLGDFSPGADDFHSGLGAQIRDMATFALAALYRQMWGHPEDLLFHRDCKADHHLCPGLSVDKNDMIERIKAEMAVQAAAERQPAVKAAS